MSQNEFRITAHMVSSLDGFVAKHDNSISWFETTDYYENGESAVDPEAFNLNIDCYLMGANTYEHALMLSENHGWAYGNVPVIVLSHRKLRIENKNIKLFEGNLNQLVDDVLKPNYKNVWVVGGPILIRDFLRHNLVDEIRQSILPVILGSGIPFYNHSEKEFPLHLHQVTAYKTGMVELSNVVRKEVMPKH